ncbi:MULTISPECIES: DMT family transporter [Neobacillus]|jgi:drug/metabolite transporter (DMT)-like permease|uniref:DMT family transporter n=1 Tax=Neobacillus TaxID=2675232 RepID=UPI000BF441DD|nr:DMT family transporter [Neobacillus sp. OS1-33]PEQ93036.1 EamA family transporter [Bacillus sp. AFS006103]WML26025.1 DMT family transporter [Neobacillus sp. OS1-33]
MWIAAAFVTMVCFGTNNTIFKWSTQRKVSKVHIQFYFYFVAFLLTFGFAIVAGTVHLNLITILLGAFIGILNANGNIQMSMAFEKGPASLTSPLVGTNTIFPILCAGVVFHEHISLIQWVGILIMLGSAMAIQYSSDNKGRINYYPWMMRVGLAIFSFGLLGILMKTSSYLQINSLDILIAMYGGGSIYLAICSMYKKEKWQRSEANVGSIVGLISILGYSSYFYALKTGTASIVFPIVSLNCLVVVLAGVLLYKEKLKRYQLIGVLTALLGIIFTKI